MKKKPIYPPLHDAYFNFEDILDRELQKYKEALAVFLDIMGTDSEREIKIQAFDNLEREYDAIKGVIFMHVSRSEVLKNIIIDQHDDLIKSLVFEDEPPSSQTIPETRRLT